MPSQVVHQLENHTAKLRQAATLGAGRAGVHGSVQGEGPSIGKVVAGDGLRQGRAIQRIDQSKRAKLELAGQGLRPGQAGEDLMARQRLLLVIGLAPQIP